MPHVSIFEFSFLFLFTFLSFTSSSSPYHLLLHLLFYLHYHIIFFIIAIILHHSILFFFISFIFPLLPLLCTSSSTYSPSFSLLFFFYLQIWLHAGYYVYIKYGWLLPQLRLLVLSEVYTMAYVSTWRTSFVFSITFFFFHSSPLLLFTITMNYEFLLSNT